MTAMFLSRARLKADSATQALAPLLLPQDLSAGLMAEHRMVWSLMSDSADRTRDFLWRKEAPGSFLILAPRPAVAGGLFDVDSKPWEPALRAGDRLGFRLRANPTVARTFADTKARGKRIDVVTDVIRHLPISARANERQEIIVSSGMDWLDRQGVRLGFIADRMHLRVDGYDTVRVQREKKPAAVLGVMEFEGILKVTDPAALIAGVAAGLGRARAFGCGLMLLRRA